MGEWRRPHLIQGSLLELVHSSRHSRVLDYRMQDLAQDSGEYFSVLRNLRSLTLVNVCVEHIGEDGFRACFSAFRDTLTYLSRNIHDLL